MTSAFATFGIKSKELVSYIKELVVQGLNNGGDLTKGLVPVNPYRTFGGIGTLHISRDNIVLMVREVGNYNVRFNNYYEEDPIKITDYVHDKLYLNRSSILISELKDFFKCDDNVSAKLTELVEQAYQDDLTAVEIYFADGDGSGWQEYSFPERQEFWIDKKGKLIRHDAHFNRKKVFVPDEVKEIGSRAFEGPDDNSSAYPEIDAVILPEGVTKIGSRAFVRSRAKSISLPSTLKSIGKAAFSNCKELTEIIIPESVQTIEEKTFESCEKLESVIIKGNPSIHDKAFYNCPALQVMEIAGNSVDIPSSAFEGVPKKALPDSSITAKLDASQATAMKIENGVLQEYTGTEANVVIPESVTEIGNSAFCRCECLTSVVIPEGVTKIGNSAFCRCERLTSVVIPESVTEIGNYTFYACESLTSVVIPESVTEIGDGAFSGCKSLADEKGFVIIKNCLYGYFGSEKEVVIPDNVVEIGADAFFWRKVLTSVVIPEGVTKIGNEAFKGCESLTSVVIPGNVTEIGREAFRDCKNLNRIHIPDSVTKIGDAAFCDCRKLTSVVIPESVTEIGDDTFSRCYSLVDEKGFVIVKNCLYEYLGNKERVIIPDNVVEIGDSAFRSCGNLKSVHIPESVTKIGNKAFYLCGNLKSVHIPERVKEIGYRVFDNCYKLESIVIPESVTKIGEYFFDGLIRLPSSSVIIGSVVQTAKIEVPPDFLITKEKRSIKIAKLAQVELYSPKEYAYVALYQAGKAWQNWLSDFHFDPNEVLQCMEQLLLEDETHQNSVVKATVTFFKENSSSFRPDVISHFSEQMQLHIPKIYKMIKDIQ